ncbi:MAG: hypothetical protein KAI17_22680 [Thiotrichaceae bacterium]|nr:hypothetical protein [Thiotrichaceae bacterium]
MTRQSISLTSPNDKWLKAQIDSEEYTSKSEIVNDLIRKARKIEAIQARLIKAEQNGFITQSRDEILAEIKKEVQHNGKL